MTIARRRNGSKANPDSGSSWISFSDLMSSLVMVFIMVMLFSMYQYYDMFDKKTQELLEQSNLLSAQKSELEASQKELSAAEKQLALKEALVLAQQTTLEDLKAQLAAQQAELDASKLSLQTALDTLETQTTRLNALVGVRAQIIQDLTSALRSANLEATIDEETGDITFSSGIYFDLSSTQLKEGGIEQLNRFIPLYFNVLLSDEYSKYLSEVVIEGHADSRGDYMLNLDLSQKRAYAVLNYLLSAENTYLTSQQKRQLRKITTATGRSSSDPVLNPDGTENEDASRRVEFKFRLKDVEMINEMKGILESLGAENINTDTQQ